MPRQRKVKSQKFNPQERYQPDKKAQEFLEAVLKLQTSEEAASFFRDVMTLAEIEEISNRFRIAKLLYQGHSYEEVAKATCASTTTVARVAHWLVSGCGGYRLILDRVLPSRTLSTLSPRAKKLKSGI